MLKHRGAKHHVVMMSQVDLTAERLSLALEAARVGDWYWDLERDELSLSARAAEICGLRPSPPLTRSDLIGSVHPDDRAAVSAALDIALSEHGEYSMDHRMLVRNRERWVTASGRALFNAEGRPQGIVGVLQDITNHRFLLNVDDAVRSLVDPQEITFAAARLLGGHLDTDRCAYAFVEDDQDTFLLTGNYARSVPSIVGRYRFRQFGAECLRLMRAGLPYIVQDSSTDPRIDEEDRKAYQLTTICGVICVPIIKSGRFVGAMAVHTASAREWKRTEVELVQQVASRCWESIERAKIEGERERLLAAAQTANRAKDEFLAMLGHELRNPLAPIRTAVQLMKIRDASVFEQERTVIERQVNHLTVLVDDLLDVSRITRGLVELKREPVELHEVASRAVEMVRPLLELRAHSLTFDVAGSGLCVDGDLQRLTQVVTNLLTNAAKYTAPGGRIGIEARRDGGDVLMRVRDNGVGMGAEELEHVFDLFVQGRQGIDRPHGGLGLGLSIAQNLVRRHGGSIVAHSEGPGHGTEVTIRLPRIDVAASRVRTPAPKSESAPLAGGRWRVLIVDDNEDAAMLLATALSLRGYQACVAHDAAAALRLAAEQAFDVGILDIGLPVMDGYELAERLQKLKHLAKLSLVAVTGYGQASDRQRAFQAGFREHLVKPVDMTTLEKVVESLAAG